MDSVILGVIIGGLFGIIPTIISLIVTLKENKQRRLSEERKIMMENYFKQKRESLCYFMEHLGAMCADNPDRNTRAKYLAASQVASIYVSEKTRCIIQRVNNEMYNKATFGITGENMLPNWDDLREALYNELLLPSDYTDNPTRKRNKIKRVKNTKQ